MFILVLLCLLSLCFFFEAQSDFFFFFFANMRITVSGYTGHLLISDQDGGGVKNLGSVNKMTDV